MIVLNKKELLLSMIIKIENKKYIKRAFINRQFSHFKIPEVVVGILCEHNFFHHR